MKDFDLLLKKYLKMSFNYQRLKVNIAFNQTILIRTAKFELYLRLKVGKKSGWPNNTLVIARISFEKTQRGHGTSFLNFLKGLAEEYSIKHIGIESTNLNSSAFAEKLNFTKHGGNNNYVLKL